MLSKVPGLKAVDLNFPDHVQGTSVADIKSLSGADRDRAERIGHALLYRTRLQAGGVYSSGQGGAARCH